MPRIQKGNSLHITFDGLPYRHVNMRQYNSHEGKGKNVKIKENCHGKQQAKLCSDHSQYVKTQKWSQPTKRLDFPVICNAFNITRFPEFKKVKDTSWKRSTSSKKVKAYLVNIHKSYIGKQNKVKKNNLNTDNEEFEPLEQLEYVIIFTLIILE